MSDTTWLSPFVPIIELLLSTLGAGLMTLVGAYVWKKWGIDVNGTHRTTYQTATKNAAGLVAAGAKIMEGVSYVQDHAPDAVRHFDAKPRTIEETIMAHVSQLGPIGTVAKAIVAASPAVDTRKPQQRKVK